MGLLSSITRDFGLLTMVAHLVEGCLALVGEDDDVGSNIPDLDCTVFRECHYLFSLAMKGDTCEVVRVSFECEDCARVESLTVWRPAAARYRLSGKMHRHLSVETVYT